MGSARFDYEEFLRIYHKVVSEGGTARDFAERLNLTQSQAQGRKGNLKKMGIKFPKMKRSNEESNMSIKRLQSILNQNEAYNPSNPIPPANPGRKKQPPEGVL